MEKSYVTKTEAGYHLTGSRVSLDSIAYDWLSGLSPESIVDNFETLSLEQVYGAVTFYLSNRAEVDAHLRRNREKYDSLLEQARISHPLLYRQLEMAEEAFS
ncbi:MAG: DUF433 domain-containing protein [Acidobacteria bacterium]|nr:DUF433 domain-containing protein [Acidobacteriota bacterium]